MHIFFRIYLLDLKLGEHVLNTNQILSPKFQGKITILQPSRACQSWHLCRKLLELPNGDNLFWRVLYSTMAINSTCWRLRVDISYKWLQPQPSTKKDKISKVAKENVLYPFKWRIKELCDLNLLSGDLDQNTGSLNKKPSLNRLSSRHGFEKI